MALFKPLALIFCLFLLLMWSTLAQQLPTRNYTTAEGLPNNTVRSLFLDSRGILWVGTENGVSKFENGVFQNFYEEDGLGLNSCWAIAEDQNGNVWFGSYGGGVSVFDGRQFHVFTKNEGLTDNRIRLFYPYGNQMLIGTEDGVSIADLDSLQISPISSSIKGNDLNYTTGFFQYQERLFYTTYRSGTYELMPRQGEMKLLMINDWLPIYSLFQDESALFLADKGTVRKIPLQDFLAGKMPKDSLGQSIVWKKLEGPNGQTFLLAASTFSKDGGVFSFHEGAIENINERLGVKSKFILSGAADQKRKILYLGSQDEGLYQVQLDEVVSYEDFDGHAVKAIAGDDKVLALLSNAKMEIRDASGGKVTVPAEQFKRTQSEFYRLYPEKIPKHSDGFFELDPSISVEDLEFYELHFQADAWWINSNIGIFQLNQKGKIQEYLPVHAYSIGFTPDGRLLETSPYAGVRIYSEPADMEFTYFVPEDPSTPLQIAKVLESGDRAYLASVFHGLYHWEDEHFFSYKNQGLWTESKFKTLHDMGGGELLVGTEFGDLYQVRVSPDFEIVKKWPKEDLQGTSILFIESYRDAIFIGTELGLHILEGEEIRFWKESGGVFNRVYLSSHRIGEALYIGLDQGFYVVDLPTLLAKQYPPVQLSVTDIRVNAKKVNAEDFRWFVYQGKDLVLGANENSLSIRFQPKEITDQGRLLYHFRITSEAEWTELSEEATVELPLLSPGEYALEVETLDLYSGQLSRSVLLQFSIAKPFYLQIWFLVLTFILLAGIFLVIYKVRTKRIKNRSRLNERLAVIKLEALQSQMNPHFIFNAINSIQYFILKKETPQALEYLGKFSKLIRSTLDQSSKALVTLEEEIAYLESYIVVENIRMDNRVSWKIMGTALERKASIQLPPMLIQPLVENVFKHAFSAEHPNPELTISYELISDKQLSCTVRDNGVGMRQESDEGHESKGIKMIREKLSLLSGYSEKSLEIHSSDRGYEVRVLIFCS